MKYVNQMILRFDSLSINEGFARSAVGAFCVQLNPTIDEITDIKTAISEAVTNCVVHAYPNNLGIIELWCGLTPNNIYIEVRDTGLGIADFEKAREPFFTTRPTEERAGMGFTVMESFMDNLELKVNGKKGLIVRMTKKLKNSEKLIAGGVNG